ncbi:MAG: bis(5'-nucleosyl)-tetraphosphatase (symmetrical) YqeK [Clostridia bacterium]|nr:bis(5'-nucleosyl)-tetraphosphatase (symmetrical) YqeK [Clostridia bacterium]
MTVEQMKEKLSTMLTDHRYTHSMGVMETAVKLAHLYGVDPEKAQIAGLLHDCAKQIEKPVQLAMCDELGLELDDIKRENLALLHAELGAELAKIEFGVTDEDIIRAIRNHTLGRKNMSDLEKILYLSDMMEPNRREYEGLAGLRELSEKNLTEATLYGLELTIAHIERKGQVLHTQTMEAERFYRNLLHKEVYHMEPLSPFEKAKKATVLLDSKKAEQVSLLKVGELTILADYFVICTGNSSTQVKAMADFLEEEFEKIEISPISREGKQGGSWILLDYGDVIIHIFDRPTREFYSLDKLWDDAEEIDISEFIKEQ